MADEVLSYLDRGEPVPVELQEPELDEWEATYWALFRVLADARPWVGTMRGLVPIAIPLGDICLMADLHGLAADKDELREVIGVIRELDDEWLRLRYARLDKREGEAATDPDAPFESAMDPGGE